MARPKGIDRVWIAPEGTAGTPLDADASEDFVALGRAYASESLAPTKNTRDDLMGRPVGVSSSLNGSLEIVDGDKYDNAAVFEETRVVLALLYPDGTFRLIRNAKVSVRYMPGKGSATNQTFRIFVRGVAASSRALMSAPTEVDA